jgi:hypothetical protein
MGTGRSQKIKLSPAAGLILQELEEAGESDFITVFCRVARYGDSSRPAIEATVAGLRELERLGYAYLELVQRGEGARPTTTLVDASCLDRLGATPAEPLPCGCCWQWTYPLGSEISLSILLTAMGRKSLRT